MIHLQFLINLTKTIATLDEFRETSYYLAGESICTEQLKQKRQYDKKVSQNRYCLRSIPIRYIQTVFSIRPEIKEGDRIVYTNMQKLKKMPNTKKQRKFIGPYTVKRVTNSHAIVSDTQHSEKNKKMSIDIVRQFYQRRAAPCSQQFEKAK